MGLEDWVNEKDAAIIYVCAFCSAEVVSDQGWLLKSPRGILLIRIRLCPHDHPTIFYYEPERVHPQQYVQQSPVEPFGTRAPKEHVPDDVYALYEEARKCVANAAYTCAVMACRKLLMNIAVEKGAQEGCPFVGYVQFLEDQHLVPAALSSWLQYIKSLGNEANHRIVQRSQEEAERAVFFMGHLLNIIYVLPGTSPPPT